MVLLPCGAATEAGSGGDGSGSQELSDQQHQNGTSAADGTENEEPTPSDATGDQQEVRGSLTLCCSVCTWPE